MNILKIHCVVKSRWKKRLSRIVSKRSKSMKEIEKFKNGFKEWLLIKKGNLFKSFVHNNSLCNPCGSFSSLIHLFSWSGLIDTNMLLGDIFKVPNLKTGKLEPLFTALTDQQEEQFRNMLNRLQTIFQVNHLKPSNVFNILT